MKIQKSKYSEIAMCWGFYLFLIDTCMAFNDTDHFIIAYGLDNEEAFYVAQKEGIEISADDLNEFYKDYKVKIG